MSLTICINANTLAYPTGGGHRWVYLNWALGLASLGCKVIWMEGVLPKWGAARIAELRKILIDELTPYGFGDSVALFSYFKDQQLSAEIENTITIEQATATGDLLLDMAYGAQPFIVDQFRRSALLDIDPGILQVWLAQKQIEVARHDVYFTIGETVGVPGSRIPDAGLRWNYIPPCVFLDAWPMRQSVMPAPFTTISQWESQDWIVHGDESYANRKRDGFMPYLEIPSQVNCQMELALGLGKIGEQGEINLEQQMLQQHGWSVRHADQPRTTP